MHKAQQQDADDAIGARATRRRAARARSSACGTTTSRSTAPQKVWKQLRREGIRVARCTVERLMRADGPARRVPRAGLGDDDASGRGGATGRRISSIGSFTATRPNQLWVADFTYVATWRGFVYVAFVIDVFARQHRRLARVVVAAHRLRARRARAGDLRALRRRRRPTWSITAIAARSTCRCATPSDWRRPASRRRSAAAAIPMTVSMMVSLSRPGLTPAMNDFVSWR